ncbi:hypothetical protein [Ancylobacter sp. FA202]|uniref:hypothetical protein n=1 Tax=Ancylobacter sp. FA202 TaxID=1111106 RepID=UPI0012DF65D5|nr:hypothetical protein [Ancylobacter sp. FA202]
MGQAKIKAGRQSDVAYHHTSSLYTNLIWMSGYIDLEGTNREVIHPKIGKIRSPLSLRRGVQDFPRLAWFTRRVDVPKCLILSQVSFAKDDGSIVQTLQIPELVGHGIALNRFALGFSISEHKLVPWNEYYGYTTAEGRALNESARDFGDNPDDWLISETPIDVATAVEVRLSLNIYEPNLKKSEAYLHDIKKMVQLCREKTGVYIPPSWLKVEQAERLAQSMGLSVGDFGGRFKG